MSQRNSGYARKDGDEYFTPAWVTHALCEHFDVDALNVWEPACGPGHMVKALTGRGARVMGTDISIDPSQDFLRLTRNWMGNTAIITNPPYEIAREFCEHALRLMEPVNGSVAMLLRTDFDHAKTRSHLFRDCPAFAKKIVLTKRITWFLEANGKAKGSPSFNHAWYIWDHKHKGPPTIAYGPTGGTFNQSLNLPGARKSATRICDAEPLAHQTRLGRTPAGAGEALGPPVCADKRKARIPSPDLFERARP